MGLFCIGCAVGKGLDTATDLGWFLDVLQDDGQRVRSDFVHRNGAAARGQVEGGPRHPRHEGQPLANPRHLRAKEAKTKQIYTYFIYRVLC